MAQFMSVEWSPGEHAEVVIPARIMLGKSAGHIFRALQTADKSAWSLEALAALDCEVILIVDNGDSASPNRKAMLFPGRLQQVTSCVWHLDACLTSSSVDSSQSWKEWIWSRISAQSPR